MKGIRSPWAQPEKAAPEDPLAGAKRGKQPVQLAGRAYTLLVDLPIRIDEERAKALALNALGEALLALQGEGPELDTELTRQKMGLNTRPLGACVTLPLGPVELHAVASSTNEVLALAMAVDRLALVLNALVVQRPSTRDTLRSHHITLLRQT